MESKSKVVYSELSYKIVGILYKVYNQLGPGYQEKYYQRAIEVTFREHKLKFKSQIPVDLIPLIKKLEFKSSSKNKNIL